MIELKGVRCIYWYKYLYHLETYLYCDKGCTDCPVLQKLNRDMELRYWPEVGDFQSVTMPLGLASKMLVGMFKFVKIMVNQGE